MDVIEVPEQAAVLIDLSDVPLDDLWTAVDDSVLAHSLRRALAAAEAPPQQQVSAFSSAV